MMRIQVCATNVGRVIIRIDEKGAGSQYFELKPFEALALARDVVTCAQFASAHEAAPESEPTKKPEPAK